MQMWMGDDQVQHQLVLATMMMARVSHNRDDEPETKLYNRQGDVGVVNVHGSLVEGAAGWMLDYGVTGYADITAALVEAIQDSEAKSIMLHVSSGGGMVSGLTAMNEFIRNVAKVKPMNVYADMAGSAAYWIAASGGHITMSETGTAGSVGTVMVHTDYSEYYAKEGIKKTVIRSGDMKMKPSGIEPLDDKTKAMLQSRIDYIADIFMRGVAESRGLTVGQVKSKLGDGAMHIGTQALDLGLVDSIGSLGSALAYSRGKAATFVQSLAPQK